LSREIDLQSVVAFLEFQSCSLNNEDSSVKHADRLLRRVLRMPAARWYQWEQDLAQLLELLAEDDDPGIQPVEVSLAQLMARTTTK